MLPSTMNLTFGPSGLATAELLVVADGTTPFVRFYDASLTKLADPASLPAASAMAVAVSADGKLVSFATSTTVYIYTVASGVVSLIKTLNSPGTAWSNIRSLTFSPDGTRLMVLDASVAPYIWIFNTSGWASLTAPNPGVAVGAVDYKGDGSQIAVGLAGGALGVALYRTSDMTLVTSPTSSGTPPRAMKYSPNGSHIAYIDTSNTMWIYRLSDNTRVSTGTQPNGAMSTLGNVMTWSSDGLELAIVTQTTPFMQVWGRSGDVFTAHTVNALLGPGRAIALTLNGKRAFVGIQNASTPRVETYDLTGTTWSHNATDIPSQPASNPFGIATNIAA